MHSGRKSDRPTLIWINPEKRSTSASAQRTEALAWLESHGLLDDAQFSQAWVTSRTEAQPMGRERLSWELRRKGVAGETVAEALQPRRLQSSPVRRLGTAPSSISRPHRGAMFRDYVRRLHIWETDFGRAAGWVAERDGKPVAVLTEPRYEEMFWVSYRLEVIAEDARL